MSNEANPQTEELEEQPTSLDGDQDFDTLSVIQEELGESASEIHTEEEPPPVYESEEEEIPQEQSPEPEMQVEIVTDEMIKVMPSLKNYVGKPLAEVVGYYDRQNIEFQEAKRKLAELEKAETKSKPEVKEPEEEPEDIPDPMIDPTGYTEYIKKLIKKGQAPKNIKEVIEETVTEREQKQAVDAENAQQAQEKIVEAVVTALPEGLDPVKAIKGYFDANKETLTVDGQVKPETLKFFGENPQILAETVAAHIYNNLSKKQIESRARSEAYKYTKSNLSKGRKVKAVAPSIPRKQQTLSDTDTLVAEIASNIAVDSD